MQVLVMRHGIALERGDWLEEDALRPLSQSGLEKTRAAALGLKFLCPRLDLIASSPLRRALQTARIVRREMGIEPEVEVWPELATLAEEDADLEPIRARVQAAASTCILFVGHEPGCSRLLSMLLCGDASAMALEWKKTGVACLEIEGENAVLQWFASPKMLRALAQKAGR